MQRASHGPSGGMADTLDEAKAAFRAAWERDGAPGRGRSASAFARKSRREMLNLSISDRMPLPLDTLDVSARVARMVGRASNKEGES